jgi:hypothetical protein
MAREAAVGADQGPRPPSALGYLSIQAAIMRPPKSKPLFGM